MDSDRVPAPLPRPWFSAVFLIFAYGLACGSAIVAVRILIKRMLSSVMAPEVGMLLPWQAFVLILAGVLLAAVLIRKLRSRMAWELLLGVTLFLGVWFYATTLFSGEVGIMIASALTLLQALVRRVWTHDVFILAGTAGVALNFAFLFPAHILLLILVGLAIYDTFAGRPGGITARFAASLVHRGVIPGLIVPARLRDVGASIHSVIQPSHRPSDAAFLGAGDLILPVVLVAHASAFGLTSGLSVTAGILLAAAWLGLRGVSKPFPALLPLAIGGGIPYAVFLLMQYI